GGMPTNDRVSPAAAAACWPWDRSRGPASVGGLGPNAPVAAFGPSSRAGAVVRPSPWPGSARPTPRRFAPGCDGSWFSLIGRALPKRPRQREAAPSIGAPGGVGSPWSLPADRALDGSRARTATPGEPAPLAPKAMAATGPPAAVRWRPWSGALEGAR